MPLSRNVLERQMDLARREVSAWVEELTRSGMARPEFRKNAKWRTLNAKCNQIQRRIDSLSKVEANNLEVEKRKAEQAAAAE